MEETTTKIETRLYDLFDKDIEDIADHIQVGRMFWMYNEQEKAYKLIEITYVRAGVAFYKQVGSVEEKAFFKNSAGACFLYPRHIFVDDVVKHIVKRGKFENYGKAYQYVYTFFRKYPLYVPDGCEIDIID